MKSLTIILFSSLVSLNFVCAQSQIVTTGNNVVNPANPTSADIVIGSNATGGTRHDASMMWWSNASASRISNTADVFYMSVWSTSTPNIGLSATVGGSSYFLGNVLIGKTSQVNTSYLLDVNGNIRSNSLVVNTTGADFVFEPTYTLLSLTDVKAYIAQNHHLPEIPSAKEMQTNGLNVGDNEIKLLQKVEELTLYLIEKDKKEKEQAEINKKQQAQIDELNKKLEILMSKN